MVVHSLGGVGKRFCVADFDVFLSFLLCFLCCRKENPHSVSYNAAGDDAKVTLIGNEDDKVEMQLPEVDTGENSTSWLPFSAQQAPTDSEHGRAPGSAKAPSGPAKSDTPAKPVMTGTLPESLPSAFPEPCLPGDGSSQRTVAFTGPVKAVSAALPQAPTAPAPSNGGTSRTVAYSGPLLKTFGDSTPLY